MAPFSTSLASAGRSWLLAVALAASLAPACKRERAPGYLRLSGAAPRVGSAEPSEAALVAFWEGWCAPCRRETPGLVALARNPPAGLRVVLVSRDSAAAAVDEAFRGAFGQTLRRRADPEGRLFDAFGVDRLPVSILVAKGQLVARFDGERDWGSSGMRLLLARLLAEHGVAGTPAP